MYIYIQMGLFLRFACAFFVYEGYLTYFQGPFDVFLKAISRIFEVVRMHICVCRAI